jgi:hypothetical protein
MATAGRKGGQQSGRSKSVVSHVPKVMKTCSITAAIGWVKEYGREPKCKRYKKGDQAMLNELTAYKQVYKYRAIVEQGGQRSQELDQLLAGLGRPEEWPRPDGIMLRPQTLNVLARWIGGHGRLPSCKMKFEQEVKEEWNIGRNLRHFLAHRTRQHPHEELDKLLEEHFCEPVNDDQKGSLRQAALVEESLKLTDVEILLLLIANYNDC